MKLKRNALQMPEIILLDYCKSPEQEYITVVREDGINCTQ